MVGVARRGICPPPLKATPVAPQVYIHQLAQAVGFWRPLHGSWALCWVPLATLQRLLIIGDPIIGSFR